MPKFSPECPFAQRLKYERERLNITQGEAAEILEVSPRAVWQWEAGKEPIKLTQEGALARLGRAKAKK